MNPSVDWFFTKTSKWQQEYSELRTLVLKCKLTEELKWGCPCYTIEKNNIVLIHCFKNYCALLFMQGALLKDEKGLLIQQTENVQSARQIRFTNMKEILKNNSTIKAYIKEAIALDKAGLKLELKVQKIEINNQAQNQKGKTTTLVFYQIYRLSPQVLAQIKIALPHKQPLSNRPILQPGLHLHQLAPQLVLAIRV